MSAPQMMLLGSGTPTIAISDATVEHSVASPTNALASYSLESDGDIVTHAGDTGDWITPKAAAGAAYEARVTIISGTLTSGTSGSWLALSTTRTWTRARTIDVAGTDTCEFTLEIRQAAGGLVLDTATITLNATVT